MEAAGPCSRGRGGEHGLVADGPGRDRYLCSWGSNVWLSLSKASTRIGQPWALPGLGLADRPADFDYSWSGLAAWYLKAIDAAGIRNFHLVVHDIGGPIGFDVIRRVPDRIKSLTVLNTLVDVSQFQRPWVMEPFAWPVIGRLWLQSARTLMFYVLIKTYGTHNINRAEADAYGQLLLGPDSRRAFLQFMRSFIEQGIKAALKARKFPAQIIWARMIQL
jgi:pimeloyl-ACP methyl ester carboxylesterase